MRIFKSLDNLPAFRNAVVTIGTFDGVHHGHQQILNRLNELAEQSDGESILLTFHPHPRFILQPDDKSLKLIHTLDEKIAQLEQSGIDNVVVAPFSRNFADMPALEYVKDFLVGKFNPKVIVIGYDHRFGKDRKGDISLLKSYQDVFGYRVEEISKQTLQDIAISSTRIRKAIAEGQVRLAHNLMQHAYLLTGFVVKGDQIGRQIGFPTANLKLNADYKLVPAQGVYAVLLERNGQWFQGMMNIGVRPTFEGQDKTLEVHIFDFDADIYGETLRVFFVEKIRDEMKFPNGDALKEQLQKDEKNVREVLSKVSPESVGQPL